MKNVLFFLRDSGKGRNFICNKTETKVSIKTREKSEQRSYNNKQ